MLLHVCCGPCSTHVVEILSKDHEIIGYFYNPNIYPYEEWLKRYKAFRKVALDWQDFYPKKELTETKYNKQHKKFLEAVHGLENEPEGGKRCEICFKLRLEEVVKFIVPKARYRALGTINTIATTLTIGRNKKAEIINPIGKECAEKYELKFLEADFKKQDGFLRSIEISKEMGLYRQKYCGCEFGVEAKKRHHNAILRQ